MREEPLTIAFDVGLYHLSKLAHLRTQDDRSDLCWSNGPKLSDGGEKSNLPAADTAPPFAGALS